MQWHGVQKPPSSVNGSLASTAVPTPNCLRQSNGASCATANLLAHLETRRRMVKPNAMGFTTILLIQTDQTAAEEKW
jgi:hypothetical protein